MDEFGNGSGAFNSDLSGVTGPRPPLEPRFLGAPPAAPIAIAEPMAPPAAYRGASANGPRRMSTLVLVAIISATALVGGAVGAASRQGAIDKQHRRALNDERSIQGLTTQVGQLSSKNDALSSTNKDQALTISSQSDRITALKAAVAAQAGLTQSCKDALNTGNQILNLAVQGMQAESDALTAASNFDVAGIQAATDQLDELTPQVQSLGPEFQAEKAECGV